MAKPNRGTANPGGSDSKHGQTPVYGGSYNGMKTVKESQEPVKNSYMKQHADKSEQQNVYMKQYKDEQNQQNPYITQNKDEPNQQNPYSRMSAANSQSDIYNQVRTGIGEAEHEYQKKMHEPTVMQRVSEATKTNDKSSDRNENRRSSAGQNHDKGQNQQKQSGSHITLKSDSGQSKTAYTRQASQRQNSASYKTDEKHSGGIRTGHQPAESSPQAPVHSAGQRMRMSNAETEKHNSSQMRKAEEATQNTNSSFRVSDSSENSGQKENSAPNSQQGRDNSWVTLTGEKAAQLEWENMMRGRETENTSPVYDDTVFGTIKPDASIQSEQPSGRIPAGMKFTSEAGPKNTGMRVGAEHGNTHTARMRTASDGLSSKSSNIRTASDTGGFSAKNMRTAGKNQGADGNYTISAVVSGGVHSAPVHISAAPAARPASGVSSGIPVQISGLHCFGGKTSDGKYHSLGTHAAYQPGSAANYLSIFANKSISEKCGLIYNPAMHRLQPAVSKDGTIIKADKEKIASVLEEAGYKPEDACRAADCAIASIQGELPDRNAAYNDATQENAKVLFNSVMSGASASVPVKEDKNLKAAVKNNQIVIYKPIGLTKTDWGIRVEKPMGRVSSMSYYYAQGVASQQDEAGQGLSNVVKGMRIASIAMPQVSLHVRNQLENELQQNLNTYTTFQMDGKKVQWRTWELKQFLVNAGINESLLDECKSGEDFGFLARAMLKSDAETVTSGSKLTAEQREILKGLQVCRSATAQERMQANNAILRKYGATVTADYGHSAVSRVIAQKKKAASIYGTADTLPAELSEALAESIMQAKQQTYSHLSGSMKLMKTAMIMKDSMEKKGAEAGKGISVVTRTAQVTKMTVVSYVKVVWAANMFAREAAQKAVLLAAKGMLAAAKTANKAGFVNLGAKLNKAGTIGKKGSDAFRNANRTVNHGVRNAKQNTKNWIRDHNPARKLAGKAKNGMKMAGRMAMDRFKQLAWVQRIMDSKFGQVAGRGFKTIKNIKNKVGSAFAHMFRMFGYVKHLIKRLLLFGVAGVIFMTFFALLINSFGATISSIFNVDSQEYDTKHYLSQQLKQYWEDDMQYAFDVQKELTDDSYDPNTNPYVNHANIKFVFEDYKHYTKKDTKKSYEKGDLVCKEEEGESHTHSDECYDTGIWDLNYSSIAEDYESFDYLQSSNNGEILSMALIKYNYDFGRLKNQWFSSEPKPNKQLKEVSDYIKKLYYGSHNLVVQVTGQTHSSNDASDGDEIEEGEPEPRPEGDYNYTEYTITVTYKTYYFNHLFDCALSDTPQRTKNNPNMSNIGALVCSGSSWESIYVAIREAGYPHNAAAGILSNLAHETGDHSEALWYSKPPDPTAGPPHGKGAYGICQWTSSGDRKQRMLDWCTANNQDSATVSGQLAWMFNELNSPSYIEVKNFLMDDNSAYDCGHKFGDKFEIYHTGSDPIQETRGTLATVIAEFFDKYKDDWSELKGNGDAIAAMAYEYLGCAHYTWGDGVHANGKVYVGVRLSSFTKEQLIEGMKNRTCGVDCSSFCQGIYALNGINNRAGYSGAYPDQYGAYYPLEQAEPGDVAWKSGHVGICIGNGKVVAASSCKYPDCSQDMKIQELSGFTGVYKVSQIMGS